MTGRDAEREQLAAALRELWAPDDPSDIDVAAAAVHAANALLPVVDRIANERAAAALEAAALAVDGGRRYGGQDLRADIADELRARADQRRRDSNGDPS